MAATTYKKERPRYKALYLAAEASKAYHKDRAEGLAHELKRIQKVLGEYGELHVLPELKQADDAFAHAPVILSKDAPILLSPLFYECYCAFLKMNAHYSAEEFFGQIELLAFRARRVLCRQ